MISGNTRVNLDAPPFFTYAGFQIAPKGLNLVGLKRAGFKAPGLSILKSAYQDASTPLRPEAGGRPGEIESESPPPKRSSL